MPKNLKTALEKMKFNLVRAVLMTKGQDAGTAKHEELRSSVEQRVGLANNEMAHLETEVVNVTQKWNANVTKAKQLAPGLQCVSGLADEVRK